MVAVGLLSGCSASWLRPRLMSDTSGEFAATEPVSSVSGACEDVLIGVPVYDLHGMCAMSWQL